MHIISPVFFLFCSAEFELLKENKTVFSEYMNNNHFYIYSQKTIRYIWKVNKRINFLSTHFLNMSNVCSAGTKFWQTSKSLTVLEKY